MCRLMFIVLTIGVTFLCPHKKVTKESGIGEVLTAGQLPRQSRLNYRALATGKRPILIRCTLQHPPYVPLPARTWFLHSILSI